MTFKISLVKRDEDGNSIDLYTAVPEDYRPYIEIQRNCNLFCYFPVTYYEQDSCKTGMISSEYLLEMYPDINEVHTSEEEWSINDHNMFYETLEFLTEKYECVEVWWKSE